MFLNPHTNYTQAALPELQRNESALAVKPPQADQPNTDHASGSLSDQHQVSLGDDVGTHPGALSTMTAIMVGVTIVIILTIVVIIAMAMSPVTRRHWPSAPSQTTSSHRLVGKNLGTPCLCFLFVYICFRTARARIERSADH